MATAASVLWVVPADEIHLAVVAAACILVIMLIGLVRHAGRWPRLLLVGVTAATATSAAAAALAGAALALQLRDLVAGRKPDRSVAGLSGALTAHALLASADSSLPFAGAATAAALVVTAGSAWTHLDAGTRPAVGRALRAVGAFALVATAGWVVSAAMAYRSTSAAVDALERGLDAVRSGDSTEAIRQLDIASDRFASADRTMSRPWARPAGAIPILGDNARAVSGLIDAAGDLAERAGHTAQLASLDALAPSGGTVDLDAVRSLEDSLRQLQRALDRDARRLEASRSRWLVPPLADGVQRADEEIAQLRPAIRDAVEGAARAPEMLGVSSTKRYLVLFTTPVETRGRIGFPGNWAELEVTQGTVEMRRFGRINELNFEGGVPQAARTLSGPDEYLARYGRFQPAQWWQHLPMSPDLPTIARVAYELYPQTGRGELDGLITLDPYGLAALLELTGPVSVASADEPLTAENAVDYLTKQQYLDFEFESRVNMLEEVGQSVFSRITSGDLPGRDRAAQAIADAIATGHVRFTTKDATNASLLRRTNIDGSLSEPVGDDLLVLTNNAGSNKIDLFLQRSIDYDVRWDPRSGQVEGALTVTLTNTAPASGLPDYLIGSNPTLPSGEKTSPPRGTNRLWLSVYSPLQPEGAMLDGTPIDTVVQTELGRQVSSLFIDIPPGGTRTFTLAFRGRLPQRGDYVLGLPAQPLVNPDRVTVRLRTDGEKAPDVVSTVLDRDRRLTFDR